jgi:hypothetical protein
MTYLRLALALYALSFLGCYEINNPVDMTYSVTGTVRDSSSNAPIEGVKVTIGGRSATTAANGTYIPWPTSRRRRSRSAQKRAATRRPPTSWRST